MTKRLSGFNSFMRLRISKRGSEFLKQPEHKEYKEPQKRKIRGIKSV